MDRVIALLASRSHGVVTRGELLAAGVTRHEIEHRLGSGSLISVHRSVFRVGHRAPSVEATYLAAVRACGEGAWLSGGAASYTYELLRGAAPAPEVTVAAKRRVRGVRIRQARAIDPRDVTVYRGIPITTVPRTLVDLASLVSGETLARACHEAGVKYGTTPAQVRAVLDRRPSSRGAGKLRRILDGDDPITISRLERGFLDLLRRANLPLPQVNRRVGARRVDCHWPEVPLTVELDGYRYHRSRHSWELDRRREREARRRKEAFRRYTWGDVYEEPDATLTELTGLLAPLLS